MQSVFKNFNQDRGKKKQSWKHIYTFIKLSYAAVGAYQETHDWSFSHIDVKTPKLWGVQENPRDNEVNLAKEVNNVL